MIPLRANSILETVDSLQCDNAALRAQVVELRARLDSANEDARHWEQKHEQEYNRATRAEAALSEQSLNIVTMTHMHDALSKSNEVLAEWVEKAEARVEKLERVREAAIVYRKTADTIYRTSAVERASHVQELDAALAECGEDNNG